MLYCEHLNYCLFLSITLYHNGDSNRNSKTIPPVQIEENSLPNLGMKATVSMYEFNKIDLPIISEITNERIYLYGIIENMGVVLCYKGRGHFYDWAT